MFIRNIIRMVEIEKANFSFLSQASWIEYDFKQGDQILKTSMTFSEVKSFGLKIGLMKDGELQQIDTLAPEDVDVLVAFLGATIKSTQDFTKNLPNLPKAVLEA